MSIFRLWPQQDLNPHPGHCHADVLPLRHFYPPYSNRRFLVALGRYCNTFFYYINLLLKLPLVLYEGDQHHTLFLLNMMYTLSSRRQDLLKPENPERTLGETSKFTTEGC